MLISTSTDNAWVLRKHLERARIKKKYIQVTKLRLRQQYVFTTAIEKNVLQYKSDMTTDAIK